MQQRAHIPCVHPQLVGYKHVYLSAEVLWPSAQLQPYCSSLAGVLVLVPLNVHSNVQAVQFTSPLTGHNPGSPKAATWLLSHAVLPPVQ
jgi:hypothetical protein